MAKNNALNFNLPSADNLFSTEEERTEARLEKVVSLNPSEISDFPDHPFKVRMDSAMQEWRFGACPGAAQAVRRL